MSFKILLFICSEKLFTPLLFMNTHPGRLEGCGDGRFVKIKHFHIFFHPIIQYSIILPRACPPGYIRAGLRHTLPPFQFINQILFSLPLNLTGFHHTWLSKTCQEDLSNLPPSIIPFLQHSIIPSFQFPPPHALNDRITLNVNALYTGYMAMTIVIKNTVSAWV